MSTKDIKPKDATEKLLSKHFGISIIPAYREILKAKKIDKTTQLMFLRLLQTFPFPKFEMRYLGTAKLWVRDGALCLQWITSNRAYQINLFTS